MNIRIRNSMVIVPALVAGTICHAQSARTPAAAADPDASLRSLPPVVVTATRTDQPSFDLPLSIDLIGIDVIQYGRALINLSEPLARVPGIVAQNRQNYAQDLQISSRGFGARSTFGVRGIRLYADGIPATMPDGQGQTSHFDLASAARIEVLRGPFSALYGNSSGGVISVFTEDGKPGFALSPYLQAGSYGTTHAGIKASGQQGSLNAVVDLSRFDTDGYREHSAASRNTANAKLRVALDADSGLTLIGNSIAMHDIQDPLGLTRAQFESNPRGVDPVALIFNTRKSVEQDQVGFKYQKMFSAESGIESVVYAGRRSTVQFQSIPPVAQLAPTSAGGVIDLGRQYAGVDLRWNHRTTLGDGKLQWTAGLNYDTLDEDRRGFENFIGATLGVKGQLRRDEENRSHNFDQYLQAQWEPDPRWLFLAGVRHSTIKVRSDDNYLAAGNGDDSGSTRFQSTSPVFGATYRLQDNLNIYASYGQGFETPTLNEMSYRAAGAGFNFGLKSAESSNFELGIKAALSSNLRANLAVFHIDTRDELTVLSNFGGRAVFQNAGKTRRDGIELALEGNWKNGIGTLLSFSALRAVYAEPFCSGACSATTQVSAGNRIPGVPNQTLYGELSWRYPALGFSTALEGKFNGKVMVDDVNSDAAPSYFVANIRAGFEQKSGPWQLREFIRIDNIGDRRYSGSVIVNEGNRRFFEPAPGRNYLAGVTVTYSW